MLLGPYSSSEAVHNENTSQHDPSCDAIGQRCAHAQCCWDPVLYSQHVIKAGSTGSTCEGAEGLYCHRSA
jgi:hypothetical protein